FELKKDDKMYGMTPMGVFFTAIFPLEINEQALCQQPQLVPKFERRLATAAVCRIERRAAYGHNLFQKAQDQQG
ncbi:hypothetical protein, partial [Flintibacter porci]|uniref:hypothetical protein n=1 Tax=Flintibacter porci TaxID=3342383 RepID=UPI003F8B90C3